MDISKEVMADETQGERETHGGIEKNLGSEVCITCFSGEFLGRVNFIDAGNYEVYLRPSLVQSADGKQTLVVSDRDTVISLANFERGKNYSIRPLYDGYIAEMARLSKKGEPKLGFGLTNKSESQPN